MIPDIERVPTGIPELDAILRGGLIRQRVHLIEGQPGTGGFGTLKQGSLEGSNVQVVEEMVDMIAAQRTYEMNTKVLSAADNMLQYLAQAAR